MFSIFSQKRHTVTKNYSIVYIDQLSQDDIQKVIAKLNEISGATWKYLEPSKMKKNSYFDGHSALVTEESIAEEITRKYLEIISFHYATDFEGKEYRAVFLFDPDKLFPSEAKQFQMNNS